MVFLYFTEGKLLSKDKWNLAPTSSNVGPQRYHLAQKLPNVGPHQLNEHKFARNPFI